MVLQVEKNSVATATTTPPESPLPAFSTSSKEWVVLTPSSSGGQIRRFAQSLSSFSSSSAAVLSSKLRRMSFSTVGEAAAGRKRKVAVDISQNFGAGLLSTGQESHKANVHEFDRYLERLASVKRHASEDALDETFWSDVRVLLRQSSHSLGFFGRPSSKASAAAVIDMGRHHVDALAHRISLLQTTLSPMFPAKFYALQEDRRRDLRTCVKKEEDAILTELLHATRVGLVSMLWSPKCRNCGLDLCFRQRLADLPTELTCHCCGACNTIDLLDRVAVTFEFNKDVLPLPPQQMYLPVGEHMTTPVFPPELVVSRILVPSTPTRSIFRYAATSVSSSSKKKGKQQQQQQQEDMTGPALLEGRYSFLSLPQHKFFIIDVQRNATEEDTPVTIRMLKESFERTDNGDFSSPPPEIVVPHGKVHFDFESDPTTVYMIMLLRQEKATAVHEVLACHKRQISKIPYTSASQMLHHATFQRLFGNDQVVSANPAASLSIRHVVLVFTDIVGSTNMYAQLGDASALRMVRQHYEVLFGAFSCQEGRVVKTVGDAVMASFTTGRAAIHAVATALRTLHDECVLPDGTSLSIRVGVHAGSTTVVPLNGINDYFGQTVNLAARVEAAAGANECLVTQDVLESDQDAALAFEEIMDQTESFAKIHHREIKLKGIEQPVGVQGFRIEE